MAKNLDDIVVVKARDILWLAIGLAAGYFYAKRQYEGWEEDGS